MESLVLGDKNIERILDQSFPISHKKDICNFLLVLLSCKLYPELYPFTSSLLMPTSPSFQLWISATASTWLPSFLSCPTSTFSRLYFPQSSQRVFLILITSTPLLKIFKWLLIKQSSSSSSSPPPSLSSHHSLSGFDSHLLLWLKLPLPFFLFTKL